MTIFKDVFLRDRAALFWIIIFPTLMYLTFSSVFSGIGKRIEVTLAFDMPKMFLPMFKNVFKIVQSRSEEEIKELVLEGKADCGIYYDKGKIKVYYGPWTVSKIGKDIIESILENIGKPEKKLKDVVYVEKGKKLSAKDFYFPSGIVMAILGVGFFGGISVEEYFKRKGLRKLSKALPRSGMPLDLCIFLSHTLASLLAIAVLTAAAIAMKTNINPSSTIFGIAYGIGAFIPLGMGLGRIFKKAAALAANLFYFSLLFLSGAFFEGKLPLSPSTTLVSILRGEFDAAGAALWIGISIFVYLLGGWMDERGS